MNVDVVVDVVDVAVASASSHRNHVRDAQLVLRKARSKARLHLELQVLDSGAQGKGAAEHALNLVIAHNSSSQFCFSFDTMVSGADSSQPMRGN